MQRNKYLVAHRWTGINNGIINNNMAVSSKTKTSKKPNQNYSTSLAGGGSVTVKNGVKTYSDKSLAVSGKNGISISGKSYSRDKGGSGYAPVITPENVQQTAVANIPTLAPSTTDFGSILNLGNAELADGNIGLTQQNGQFVYNPKESAAVNAAKEANLGNQNALAQIAQYLKPETDQFSNAFNKIEKESGINNYRKDVNNYSNQLNAITSSRDAEILKLEGQGRGQTQGFIGGEQARINREAAIVALPVQAQLAAAQGNLELAQSRVNTLFQIKSQDISAQNSYKTNLANSVMQFANQSQQNILNAKLGDIQKQEAAQQQAIQDAKQIALQAIEYGQSSLASRIMGLDPKSATYSQDVRNTMAQLRKPVAATSPKAPTLQNFGTATAPLWKQYNPSTGEWDDVQGLTNTPTSNALGNALASQDIYNVNNILNSKGLDSAVGPTGLARTEGGLWSAAKRFVSGFLGGAAVSGAVAAPTVVGTLPAAILGGLTVGTVRALQGSKDELTGDRANFIGSVEQMVAGLTQDKLAQAKGQGVTFGALSDGERQMIAQAASKIGTWRQREGGKVDGEVVGYKVNEKDFKKEVDTINYFKQLDAYLQGASPEEIGAQVMPDGTVWVMDSFGNMRQLISNQ